MTRPTRLASICAFVLSSLALAAAAVPASAADAAPRPGPATARLAKPVTVDYRAASLDDVLADLQKKLGGSFRLDKAKLAERGFKPAATVTLALRDVPAAAVLAQALRAAFPGNPPVAYADGDAVVVAPEGDVPARTVTASYALARRQPNDDDAKDHLVRLVTQVVAPDTWRENGGAVGTVAIDPKGNLLVTSTPAVQEQVRWLLATLAAPPAAMTVADTPARKSTADRLARPLAAAKPGAAPAATLEAAIDRVRQGANVNVVVIRAAIENAGLRLDAVVTPPAAGPAADVLERVTKQASGDAANRIVFDVDADGVVLVTTAEHAAGLVVLGVYDVRGLGGPDKAAEVATQLTKRVAPEAWRENGGSTAALGVVGTAVVVSAPRRTHAEVAAVLNAMAKPRR